MENEYVLREYFVSKRGRGKLLLDMPHIYRQIDNGIPLQEIADKLNVSISTIYRRHLDYQKEARAYYKEMDELPTFPEGKGKKNKI